MTFQGQIIKVRNCRPIKAGLLPVFDQDGFPQKLAENPLEGPYKVSKAPVVRYDVPSAKQASSGRRLRIAKPNYPSARPKREKRFSDEPLLKASSFIWVGAWIVIYLVWSIL